MEGTNPIKWKPLVVSGHDSEVVMGLMDTDDNHIGAYRSLVRRQQVVRMLATQCCIFIMNSWMPMPRPSINLLS